MTKACGVTPLTRVFPWRTVTGVRTRSLPAPASVPASVLDSSLLPPHPHAAAGTRDEFVSLELYINDISLSVCFFGLVSSTQQNYSEALVCSCACVTAGYCPIAWICPAVLMHPPVQVMGPAPGLGGSGDAAGSARGGGGQCWWGRASVPGGTAPCGAVRSGWVGPCVRMRAELPMCRVSSGACGARGFGFPCACGRPPVPGSASRRAAAL